MEYERKSSVTLEDVPTHGEERHVPALIPVAQRMLGTESVPTVDGRDLHSFLGVAKDYSNWMKAQLKRGRFIEGRDFIRHAESSVIPSAQKGVKSKSPMVASVSYHLTFDAAKHVAMMSNAEKGHEVREYFIAKEKELQALTTGDPSFLDSYPELKAIAAMGRSVMALAASTAELRNEVALARQENQTNTQRIEANEAQTVRAEAKADTAVQNQNFWTIAEYVQYHDNLRRQCPESAYVEASNHMRAYCKRERLNFRDPNVLPRRIPVGDKNWETEWGFHVSVYEAAFLPWLLRRNSQTKLGWNEAAS